MAEINRERVLADFRETLEKDATTVKEAEVDATLLDEVAASIEVPDAEEDGIAAAREDRRKFLIAQAAVRKANLAKRRAERVAANEDMATTYAKANNLPYKPVLG